MPSFRLVQGSYAGKETGGVAINAKRNKGNELVVESEHDLATLYPGKFVRTDPYAASQRGKVAAAQAVDDESEPEQPKQTSALPEDFDSMTVEELREFAAEEEISLPAGSNKKEIQAAIREEMEARAGD